MAHNQILERRLTEVGNRLNGNSTAPKITAETALWPPFVSVTPTRLFESAPTN